MLGRRVGEIDVLARLDVWFGFIFALVADWVGIEIGIDRGFLVFWLGFRVSLDGYFNMVEHLVKLEIWSSWVGMICGFGLI